VKRRTMIAGLVGGSVAAVTGLSYRRWTTRHDIDHQTLAQFTPSKDYDVCIVGTGPAGCTLAQPERIIAGVRIHFIRYRWYAGVGKT
jgi:ribulose 1,5-bisphosphate synthetase/thiazole synthase